MNYKTINDMREAGMGWQAISETLQAQRNDALEQLNRARDDYETAMHSLGTSHEDYEDAMRALDQMETERNRLRELLTDAADSIIAEGQRKAEAGGPVGTIVGHFDDHKMLVAMHGEKLELGTELYEKPHGNGVRVSSSQVILYQKLGRAKREGVDND